MRAALVVALLALTAAADAQRPGVAYPTRQTALAALGRTQQLTGQPANGYRVAARTGVGAPGRAGAPVKPFSNVTRDPVISPYINLFREEEDNAAPNYHLFVQPQLQQQELLRAQQLQLLQLQRRVQSAVPQANVTGGARYGDTGRYYSGWQR